MTMVLAMSAMSPQTALTPICPASNGADLSDDVDNGAPSELDATVEPRPAIAVYAVPTQKAISEN
jgi:hypothetical protein